MTIASAVKDLAIPDIFKEGKHPDTFIGRPFSLDYSRAMLLVADAWKMKVCGVPQGTLLLAFYENESNVQESLLLRAIRPTSLPTDSDVISSMVEYYKDNLKTGMGNESQLDTFTKYQFSFSGLECRVLGTFYKDAEGSLRFGADVENFYSAHNYSVYKPKGRILEVIVNLSDGNSVPGGENDFKIGRVRYSSSTRFQSTEPEVPVYISPKDFLGKRTSLFGMTRTGKSNTVKKVIQATVSISDKAKCELVKARASKTDENLEPFDKSGGPKFKVGQIIFDINGEYANANLQDEGTAIFELYEKDVTRYSVLEKEGFKVMKVNFYKDITAGFELIGSHLADALGDYVSSFKAVDLNLPEDDTDTAAIIRAERRRAAYLSSLYRAGLKIPKGFKVKFQGNATLNKLVQEDGAIDPSKGITLEEASNWFATIWDEYNENEFFSDYKRKKGHEWADEDLKALMVFLTGKRTPGGSVNVSGYKKLRGVLGLHTDSTDESFEAEIVKLLRDGKIIIVDLSQGDPEVQRLYSERICTKIFTDSMASFIKNDPNNFVQFYFEEAHNLFPRREDSDLSQIYNRLAKEGAKLNLGLIYATQEVSSISANILKNTQNWFIAHLNNEDELKELRKYYDFADFTEGLVQFSASSDKGFVRMKTYSNPFVVPVQIDRFLAKE